MDTLLNTPVPPDVWVDLYAENSIGVGTEILVQNIGVCDMYLASQAAQPTDESARQILGRGEWVVNDPGDAGAWAYCGAAGGAVNVRVK